MVDRIAARMVISYSVDQGWTPEHLDVKSSFLHEDYLYDNPVYIYIYAIRQERAVRLSTEKRFTC